MIEICHSHLVAALPFSRWIVYFLCFCCVSVWERVWTYRECFCVFEIWVHELSEMAAFGTQNNSDFEKIKVTQFVNFVNFESNYDHLQNHRFWWIQHKLSKIHSNLSEIKSNLTFAQRSQFWQLTIPSPFSKPIALLDFAHQKPEAVQMWQTNAILGGGNFPVPFRFQMTFCCCCLRLFYYLEHARSTFDASSKIADVYRFPAGRTRVAGVGKLVY